MNLMPTHRCFDDALDFLSEHIKADPSLLQPGDDRLVLVHAICVAPPGPHDGEHYAHAWVEQGDRVWDAGLLNGEHVYWSADKAEYYAAKRVLETVRYTPKEALTENWKHNHFGPWKPELVALCGGGNRILGSVGGPE